MLRTSLLEASFLLRSWRFMDLRRVHIHRSMQTFIGVVLVLNLLFMVYLAVQQHSQITESAGVPQEIQQSLDSGHESHQTAETFAHLITVVIRQFENFDNYVVNTIKELKDVLPGVKFLVVGDSLPYPPLSVDKTWNADIISLETNLMHNYSSRRPDHLIKTKFVLLLPDGVKLKYWKHLQTAANLLGGKGRTKAVALGVGSDHLKCFSLDINLKRWQIMMTEFNTTSDFCDMFVGDHALLVQLSDFRLLAEPFARPATPCFYIQAKLRQWKIRYLKRYQLVRSKTLFADPHTKWKHKLSEEERVSHFYKQSGIKLVNVNGLNTYYGCTKSTPRCFATIIDDMPDYLYQGKWTPPCCLKALRETAKHVFGILEKEDVRYWLEGGSLLGAARNHDIIPWDYDVDIGIYRDDVEKSSYLKDASQSSFVDEQGFLWEKASEGDFFRVQYSEKNHLHVDIHPFYPENGIMTKNTWFQSHRQDTEFPEHFLKPLIKISFAGVMVNAPNSVQQFLEYKFGAGVINQPRFPNFKKVHE